MAHILEGAKMGMKHVEQLLGETTENPEVINLGKGVTLDMAMFLSKLCNWTCKAYRELTVNMAYPGD